MLVEEILPEWKINNILKSRDFIEEKFSNNLSVSLQLLNADILYYDYSDNEQKLFQLTNKLVQLLDEGYSFHYLSPAYAYRTHIYLLQKYSDTNTLDSFIVAFHNRFPIQTNDAYLHMLYVQKHYQLLNDKLLKIVSRSSSQDILFALCNIQLKNSKEVLNILDTIRINIEKNLEKQTNQGIVYNKKSVNEDYENSTHLTMEQIFAFWEFSKKHQKNTIACKWQTICNIQLQTYFQPIPTNNILLIEPYFLDIRRANNKRTVQEKTKWVEQFKSQKANCK